MDESRKDEDLIRELKRLELSEHLTGEKAGAEKVFATLIDRHHSAFAQLVMIRYGMDAASADEIAQDFWLECYSALPRYNPERPFLSWATTILFRTAEKFIRKRKREVQLSAQNDFFELQASSSSNPESEVLSREQMSTLLSAVRKLPADLGLLIQLRYFEQRKIEEIVEMTGLARSTVFEKLNLAYRKLRRLMGEE